jgi:hypothetical protein
MIIPHSVAELEGAFWVVDQALRYHSDNHLSSPESAGSTRILLFSSSSVNRGINIHFFKF